MSEDSKDFNPPQAAAKQADAPPESAPQQAAPSAPEPPRVFLRDTIRLTAGSQGTHNAELRERTGTGEDE